MTEQKTYAEKINKLLRKAESTDSPDEAELLYAKAQELMTKYAIDEAMLAANTGKQKDQFITSEEFVIVGIYRHALMQLTYIVLLNNDLKAIRMSGSPWRTIGGRTYKETHALVAVGYKSDLDRARVLATSLQLQAMRAENKWWSEHSYLYESMPKGQQHQARRGYLLAFASGVDQKLKAAKARARQAADTQHGSSSVALVLRDRSLMVQDEFTRLYPQTRKSSSRINAGDAFARAHGREAGERADTGQTSVKNKERRQIN